jgi:hypothetical protein
MDRITSNIVPNFQVSKDTVIYGLSVDISTININSKIPFDLLLTSSCQSVLNSSGTFTLKGGKKYKITVAFISKSTSANGSNIQIYDVTNSGYIGLRSKNTPVPNTDNINSGSTIVHELKLDSDKQIEIRLLDNNALTAYANGTYIYIEELESYVATVKTEVLTVDWDNVNGKPSTFPPSPHTHNLNDLAEKSYNSLTDKPDQSYQITCNDNDTTIINVADITLHRVSFIDYTIQDVAGTMFESGRMMIIHNGVQTSIDIFRFGLIGVNEDVIDGIDYISDINSNNLRLHIIATSIGSNLKFVYTNKKIVLAT